MDRQLGGAPIVLGVFTLKMKLYFYMMKFIKKEVYEIAKNVTLTLSLLSL
jgi:hypothetical protein